MGVLSYSAHSQLAVGATAPNFTVTDINGNTHTLYDYTSAGKTVVLDFSTTWCGPCWSYHESHELKNLYNQHGPSGTTSQDFMVIFIESDSQTTLADLNGTGSQTNGNWVAGTPYPIVDQGGEALADTYHVQWFPTIYVVCSDNKVVNVDGAANADVGFMNVSQFVSLRSAKCPASTNNNTSSTINVTQCNTYTVPSGHETYTTSGTYYDTIPNSGGGDSLMTINLTINTSTTSSTNHTACNTYTWGGNTYNTSGTYTWTGQNAAGCDSTATLNLTINSSSTSSETRTSCNSYTWNGNTYNTSGTYTWTGQNAAGCDSVATLNLTINPSPTISASNTNNPSSCGGSNGSITVGGSGTGTVSWTGAATGNSGSVTLPYTITNLSSGAYNIVFNNGCASNTLTTSLSDPGAPAAPTASVNNACGSSTLTASGSNLVWSTGATTPSITVTSAGTYSVNQTVNGCTSSSTAIVANPLAATSSTSTQTACNSYAWNGSTYSTSGTYTWTGQNAAGCDSVATLNLTINTSDATSQTHTSCGAYTWNGSTYSTSGTYTWTGQNASGCDSVVTLNLTVNMPSISTTTHAACDSYEWNGNLYNQSGTYTWTGQNAAGCDSVATLNLTITTIDAAVTVNGTTITANMSGANYQWIDCDDNNAPISGATSHAYTPTETGNYAVIVSQNGCEKTSECKAISFVGLENNNLELAVKIYPNPAKEVINITLPELSKNNSFGLYNSLGQLILSERILSENVKVNTSGLEDGIYLLRIHLDDQTIIKRVAITK